MASIPCFATPVASATPGWTEESELLERGWTTAPLLDAPEVHELQALLQIVALEDRSTFYASPAHAWGAVATSFHDAALEVLAGVLDAAAPSLRPFMVAATVKPAGAGPLLFHHDWTYTDEAEVSPTFLWIPLVDVDRRNGCLEVVSNTHVDAPATIRPSRGPRGVHPTEPLQAEYRAAATAPRLAAGEALVFHPATIHGSGPNDTDRTRPAITVALVPKGADLVHFHLDEAGHLSGHAVEPSFFTSHPYATRPSSPPTVRPWAPSIATADLAATLRAGRSRSET